MASPVHPLIPPVRFFNPEGNPLIDYTYAIIVSQYRGQWIWVKHKERDTWELPAGHLEKGETPLQAAQRELYEETGALKYKIDPVISYEGMYNGMQVFGMIFLAHILNLGPLPEFEIGEIKLFSGIPDELTYPQFQPAFFNYVVRII